MSAMRVVMPSRTYTFSFTESVYFFENETIRSLMIVIQEVGLPLDWLLDRKEPLLKGMRIHLEKKELQSLKLVFYDRVGNTIANGFGSWLFKVRYDTAGFGIVEVPVEKIYQEIKQNRWALATAASYEIQLTTTPGTPLLPGWSHGKDGTKGSKEIYLGSYGTDQINGTIHRR